MLAPHLPSSRLVRYLDESIHDCGASCDVCPGIDPVKLEHYGDAFLELRRARVETYRDDVDPA